jgi:hypothetical protein
MLYPIVITETLALINYTLRISNCIDLFGIRNYNSSLNKIEDCSNLQCTMRFCLIDNCNKEVVSRLTLF